MNRELFVRMATVVLRQMADPAAAEKAEAIAMQMDLFAAVMGDGPVPAAAAAPSAPPQPPPAFPTPNPEAMAPMTYPSPEAPREPSLIVTDTRMPGPGELGKARPHAPSPLPPQRGPRPAGRMKVEELNILLQERTPKSLPFEVPMEDGQVVRAVFQRDVISMHGNDSVKLVYFPPGTPPIAREATEVQMVVSVDDIPIDLVAALAKLKQQAIDSLRPRGQIVSVTPRVNMGPVRHVSDTYNEDPAAKVLTGQTQSVFSGIG